MRASSLRSAVTTALALVTAAEPEELGRHWTVSEAAASAMIDFPVGWPDRRRTDAYFAHAGVGRSVLFEVSDVAAAIEMARTGLGAAFLPASLVDGWTGIQTVDLTRPIPARTLVLAQHTLPLRPAVKALSDLLVRARSTTYTSVADNADH